MSHPVEIPFSGKNMGTGTHPSVGTGRWYRMRGGISVTAATVTQSRSYWQPLQIPFDATFNGIAVNVTTAAASSSIRMGLAYDDNGAPGVLLADFGTVSSTTTGVKTITPSQAIKPAKLWVGVVAQGGNPSLTKLDPVNATGVEFIMDIGLTSTPVAGDFTTNSNLAFYKDSVTGAFANPIGAMTGITGSVPLVFFKVG